MTFAQIAAACHKHRFGVAEEEARDRMASIITEGNKEWHDYWDMLLGHELAKRTDAALYLSSMLYEVRSPAR